MGTKRKWQENDWEVVMPAQSFVAVLASTEDQEDAKTKSKTKAKSKSKKKVHKPTRRSPRGRKKTENSQEDTEMNDATATTPVVDEFWLAQLQDDVTEDMLAQEDACVHVTWLNKVQGNQYKLAYDEQVDVGSILCHVYLKELSETLLELTTKSLERVQRSLTRTKKQLAGETVEDDVEEDNERPPLSNLTSTRKRRSEEDEKPARFGRGKAPAKKQKLGKRDAAMHIPPLRASVDESKYEDKEMLGKQPLESFNGDVTSTNREVLRAVLTKNVKMLKTLTTSAKVYGELSTFDANRSADVKHSAIHYAIDNDDLAAAALLRQTNDRIEKQHLAGAPEVALPSHSTGQHTSRFSDYNRRAINASRGGKEGNNALLEDSANGQQVGLSLDYLWQSSSASVEMLTLLYPTGEWTKQYDYTVSNNVCRAARVGNFRLLRKVVETLEKNGGWGFNELHHRVLADRPADGEPLLPQFRVVSAIKQANTTRLRPLHLSAINPNTQYLEALWAVAGDEFGAIKDDQGYEPIHYAACCESAEPMTFLLERRCSMFGRTKTRLTPLMCALEAGRDATALALLKFAATPGESGGGGQEVADKLVKERGPAGKQAMHFAAEHGCAEVLKYLLTECAGAVEINGASGGTSKATPLTLATQHGHLKCVQALLAHGARVDLGDKLKKTPLILAVKNGHTRIAAALINAGANVNAYDTSENSVAHYAASYGWPSCLQLLIDVGAELWAQNAWGFVPLACALLKQRRTCAELILAQVGGDEQRKFLDFRDRQGRTMLFLQCEHSRDLGELGYLLDKGLDPNISDSEGEYPLQQLIKRACNETPRTNGTSSSVNHELAKFFLEAIRLLLQHGAHPQYELFNEVQQEDEKDQPKRLQPLQQAMEGNQIEIVDLLLEKDGVQPEALSMTGSDAWMTAASLGAGVGDILLSKLLDHHSSKSNDGPLMFKGRTRPHRMNFFHIVAQQSAENLAAVPDLICQCAEKCATTAEMMCEKDAFGYTPVMRLLDPSQERKMSVNASDPDKLQHAREIDARLAKLFALYAEKTKTRDAFVRCEEATQLRKLAGVPAKASKGGDVSASGGVASDSDSDSDYDGDGDNDDDDDGDDSGDGNSDDDDDDTDDDAEARVVSKPVPLQKDGKPTIVVEYETALHFIAQRKLTSEPANPWQRWYGCGDQSTRCLMHILLEKRPELFASDADSSLVNFTHLGSFKTALQFAVEAGDVVTVRTLLTHHANANKSPVRCTRCKTFAVENAIARASGHSAIAHEKHPVCTGNCGTDTLIEPPLFEAIKSKQIKCTHLLLKHGAVVTCFSDTKRETPLHVALRENDGEAVSALLSHGASLMAKDSSGATPLHLAVVARHSIPVQEPHEGEVAYSTISITQSFPSGRSISAKTSPFSVTTSSEANQTQRAQEVEPAIVIALKDSSAQQAVIVGDTKNRSPIHYAARNRDLELLRELLRAAGKHGAQTAVNQRDWLGRTPLHYAVNAAAMSADASFAVERFLLQNGASVNSQDDFGFGPLHFALIKVNLDWHDNYDTNHKKQGGQKDRDGQIEDATTYEAKKREAFLHEHLATIPSGDSDPVETVSNLAAERGLNIMAQDALGRSPLHLAAAIGAFVCVSTLLSALGNTQTEGMALQDHEEFTPLGLAVLHKRQTTIMTLLRSGSAVDGNLRMTTKSISDSKPKLVQTRSYFYHAVSNGLTGICHMLLSAKFCRRQAIEDSVRCGRFQLANNLLGVLEAGSDGGLGLLRRPNSSGETLLHSLAKTKQTGFSLLARNLAWALVDSGVSVDAQDKEGNLAVHYAARNGNTQLLDFLHHLSSGTKNENVKNNAGETPLLFCLKQKFERGSLNDDQVLEVMCYFLEHPSHSLDVNVVDASGMNILSAFLDRFTETLAVSKPVLFFAMLESLLKRGVDPNTCFHSIRVATQHEQENESDKDDKDRLLRSGRQFCETTKLAAGDVATIPPLIRVAFTKDAAIRFYSLALLLRYGAKLTTTDDKGNNLLMHLAARNFAVEMRLALGLVKSVPEPKDIFTNAATPQVNSLHVPNASVKAALAQHNGAGLTVCHMAVQPLEYGSYENTLLLAMIIRAGGDLRAKDASGKTPVDYAREQRSGFVLQFLKDMFPKEMGTQVESSEDVTVFETPPAYSDDAAAYLQECETSGKISRSRVVPKVNTNCDVGKVSSVFSEGEDGELDALLTKVDVKNGRFGLNVFYRLQLVRDELQSIFVLFTNWGRIGETGKFQNTPFRDQEEAVNEFKKIFRSKTGNPWESRAPGEFVKKPKKYNLVQRVNYATKVNHDVTRSFREDMEDRTSGGVLFTDVRDQDLVDSPSVVTMLAAITDVRNLQLAAKKNCGFGGGELPLAKQEELIAALEKLHEIRGLLEEKDELMKEIGTASGDLSEEGVARRALLSTRHEALTENISERSSRYYEIMPCQEDGGDALASSIKAFDQVADVNVEIIRLKQLSDIMETYKILLGAKRSMPTQNPLEYCYHALQVRLAALPPTDHERQLVHRYFFNGLKSYDRERYRISNVFEVERRGEFQRFNDLMEERPDLHQVQKHLLWHGTRRTNLMGILSQGLRVAPPEAPHHGYAYGKGLYFADVAQKSLSYCDAPYALPILGKDGKPDKSSSKTREVHYMLLCEVALGKPTELMTTAAWGTDPLPREGMDSVKALSKNIPEPKGTLVSPKCGAMLHVGRVKMVGREIPFSRVWAKTDPSPTPIGWYERNPKFTVETQQYLAKLVEDKEFVVGTTHSVSSTPVDDRAHFVQYNQNQRTVTIELVDRSAGGDETGDTLQPAAPGAWCEATLKVNIQCDDGSPNYSYSVKLYRNILTADPIATGYSFVEPSLSEYAELVVYKEAQARLRYVVEVESV